MTYAYGGSLLSEMVMCAFGIVLEDGEALHARHMPCGCTWRSTRDEMRFVDILQHGDNPEAKLTITDWEMYTADLCEKGHLASVEAWMLRVVAYAHPPVDLRESARENVPPGDRRFA